MNISEVKVGDRVRVVGEFPREQEHEVVAMHGFWVGLVDAAVGEIRTGEPPNQSSNRIARRVSDLESWDE